MMRQAHGFSRVAWTTAGLFLAWLNLDGRSRVQAGDFAPGITVGSRLDERSPSAVNGGQWVASVTPQLTVGRPGPIANWEFSARRAYESYYSAPAFKPATDMVSLSVSSVPTEHSELALGADYVRSEDLLLIAPGIPLPSGWTELASGSVRALAPRGEAAYQIRSTIHEAAGQADGLDQAWTAAVFPMSVEHSRLLVRWTQKDWWLDDSLALRVGAATAGYHRDHTAVFSSELEVGLADSRDEQHGSERRDFALYAGVSGLGRAMGLPFNARAQIAHDASTTGSAHLWRSGPGTRLEARWERTLDARGGRFDGPTLRDLVGFEVRDTLGGRTVAILKGSYARTRSRVAGDLRVDVRNATASLTRQLQPWLSAKAVYLYSSQAEFQGADLQDFERSRAEFTLTAALP